MKFKVDTRKFTEDLKKELLGLMKISEARLAEAIYTHIVDLATHELNSTRQKFLDNLHVEHDHENVWVISLDDSVNWIEYGLRAGTEMLPHILESPKAKVSKDGHRYVNVPFNQGTPKSHHEAQKLKGAVQEALAERGISLDKVETTLSGEPKIGLLHTLNVTGPNKTGQGAYQGKGPVNDIRVGHKGHPLLYGVKVYQHSTGAKSVMTFRVASDKQNASQYWVHPGTNPKHFFARTEDWIYQNWDTIVGDSGATTAFGLDKTVFTAIENIAGL